MQVSKAPPMVVSDLSKSYGLHEVISGLTMHVDPGEIICIVGPSGVGKTTLLRCLSGLMPPTSGTVNVGGTTITQPLKEIGVVFQDYRGSLMPWMRTAENVAFPLQGRGVGKAERNRRAEEALEVVGLKNSGRMYPWELSGGMQQRVSIARALAYDAHILLMDEPFGSLDAQTRLGLEDLVLDLRARLKVSVIIVTHDIDEAVYLADRVIVLAGKPASVVDVVDVDLGYARTQLETKSDQRFVEYRNRVLSEIMLERT